MARGKKWLVFAVLFVGLVGFVFCLFQLNSDLKKLRQVNNELMTEVTDLTSKVEQLENSIGTQSVFTSDDIETRLDELQDKVEGFDGLQDKVEDLDGRVSTLELWSQ